MRSGILLLVGSTLTVLALMACGDIADDGTVDIRDPGMTGDATPPPTEDSDAGFGAADSATPRPAGTLSPDPGVRNDFEAPETSPAVCVDARFDDEGTPTGCQIDSCARAAQTCCVGRVDCCTDPLAEAELDFGACDGACGLQLFGSPTPNFDSGFFPGGDASADSGAAVAGQFDLRNDRIRVEGVFVPENYVCDDLSCLEAVGIGLSAELPQDDTSYVAPLFALTYAAGEMRATVGTRVLLRSPSSGGRWSFEALPSGTVELYEGDVLVQSFRDVFLPQEVHVLAYGHNANPPADARGAHLTSLSVQTQRCSGTRAWDGRERVMLGAGGSERPLEDGFSPTTARDTSTGVLHAAYMMGQGADRRLVLTRRPDDAFPRRWLSVDTAYEVISGEISDPELVYQGEMMAYFMRDDELRRARFGRDDKNREILIEEESIGLPELVSAPSIVYRGAGLRMALVARSNGRIVAISFEEDGSGAALHSVLPTGSLVELGDPEVFTREGLFEVYVPHRRGTRWRLAHFSSEDFIHWNLADKEAMLPLGQGERFGPRAPSVELVELAGSVQSLELFYERFDGVRHGIGRATRALASGARIR